MESVLWGEIRRFISTARYNLDSEKGGPIIVNHLHLRRVIRGETCPISYCIGRVAAKGEGLLGHHVANTGDGIPRTLAVFDEASGIDDDCFERTDTWAQRKLVIGNPYGIGHWFHRAVKGGDIEKDR